MTQTHLFLTCRGRYRIRIFISGSVFANKMKATNVTIFCTHKSIASTTANILYPSCAFLWLPFLAREVEKYDQIAMAIFNHAIGIPWIILARSPSASFRNNHFEKLKSSITIFALCILVRTLSHCLRFWSRANYTCFQRPKGELTGWDNGN